MYKKLIMVQINNELEEHVACSINIVFPLRPKLMSQLSIRR